MRIGQLARRLGVPPTEILGFLSSQSIEAEGGTNSRLSNESVVKVINRFAPERLSELMAVPAEEPETVRPIIAEAPGKPLADEQTPGTQPLVETEPGIKTAPGIGTEPVVQTEPTLDTESTAVEPPEVIRVSKVELQGLKVLGKIDLPAPKKKAEPTETDQQEQPQQQQQPLPPRREFQKRNDRREREWKNPVESRRQQEAREIERKKKEEADRVKEKRTNHYYNKVKSVPTKAARRLEEQTVVEDVETKEPPKGIFGKFLRWLRT